DHRRAAQNCLARVVEQRIGKRIAAANDGQTKLDIFGHSIAQVTTMNKYILVLLGGIVAMAFLASCQQQGSSTTATQPTTTTSPQHSTQHTPSGVQGRTRPSTTGTSTSPVPSPTP